MCGIAGRVDFSLDLESCRALVENMTLAIRRRGPDDSGVWIDGHAALGHRRLAVIDIDGGRQPMVVPTPRGNCALTFSGEIYNYRQLRAELAGLGHRFRTSSDTEVLLHAYLEWETGCLQRLDGMFAFAVWDAGRQRLLLGRDRVGIKPLYYASTDDGVIFGSEPKALLASGQLSAAVDRDGLREILDMVKRPGAAVFRGMRELRPGHFLTTGPEGLREHRYWRLEAREHSDSLDVTIERIGHLLNRTVRDQLVSDVPLCSLLSGGLDSSAITAIAADVLRPQPLRTFAVDFRANTQRFSRDAVRHSSDSPYAQLLADHLATEHHEILLDGDRLLNPQVRSEVLTATDLPPVYWGDMWPSLLLLFEQVRQHATVAISGEGADELFGGYQWFFNANASAGTTFPWLTSGSSRYFGGSGLLDRELLRSLELDQARQQSYMDAVAQAPALSGESTEEARMRLVSYLNLTRFMQTLLDRKDRMSMAVGLEVRVPYCDHHLMEYVFNVPWRMKSFDGREKSLLREAMRGRLPTAILDRRKNPYPAIQDVAYEKALRRMLADIYDDPSAPVLPFLDRAKVETALRRQVSEVSLPYARGSLELTIWLNAWLKRYSVKIIL